jgi:hypothetical protein
MILLGLVVIAIGALGALTTVAFVTTGHASGTVDVVIFGSSLGTWSSSTLLWVTVGAAAATGVVIALGIWALTAGRRRRVWRERQALASDIDRLTTVRRLLEERVEGLGGEVRDLDRISVGTMPVAPVAADGGDLIVLPEAPPAVRA